MLLDASPHQAALDDVLPGGASLTMVRQTTTRSRLPSAAGAAGGSGDPVDRTPAAWEAAAEAARAAVLASHEEGAAEVGAASAKRAAMVPRQRCACPLHMHTLSHTPHPRRAARMCCRAYQLSAF